MSVSTLAAATRTSHRVAARCDVYRAGVLIAQDLAVVAGNVQVSSSSAVRRRCSVSIVDPSGVLIPNDPSDALAPYGNEVQLFRGVGLDVASLGLFRIEQAEVQDAGAVIVNITGFDRAGTIQEARFETPYVVAAGTNYGTAIQSLITSRFPSATFSFTTTSNTTPLLVFEEGGDPWDAAQNMAASVGMELFFDAAGVCVLRPEPNPLTAAVAATFLEGTNSVVVGVTNNLTAKPAYNKFIVTGEPVDGLAPVRAEALDNNPASPTYYFGAFGKRPRFFRSQFITTTAQAQATADAFLLRELGGSEQVTFNAVPNAALDAGDVVQVTRARIGVDTIAVIESLSMPLDAGSAMQVTTRKRRSST